MVHIENYIKLVQSKVNKKRSSHDMLLRYCHNVL